MADDVKRPAPPYIAFQTLKTLLQNMKADGVPGRIDKTMLRNFSGAVASQLITALKFLNLTDFNGHPMPPLRSLVDAYGTDVWPERLGGIIRTAFSPIFTLDLETATPGQFNETFSREFDGEGDTMRKAVTFFVNAVREADIPISTYIMKNKKPRTGAAKKRASKPAKNNTPNDGANGGNNGRNDTPPAQHQNKPPSEILLGLFDPKMEEKEKNAIWTLIQFFKENGK